MNRRTRFLRAFLWLVFTGLAAHCSGQETLPPSKAATRIEPANYDRLRTGDSAEGRIVVPTNQVLSPAGRQVAFSGRPTDLALSPDGRWLGVLENTRVSIIDPQAGTIASRVALAGGGSFTGIVFSPDGQRLFASTIRGTVGVFSVDQNGQLKAEEPIRVPPPTATRGE